MKVTVHQWGGVVADVYEFAAGEKLPRHAHSWVHTTAVIRGRSLVTMFNNDGTCDCWEMTPPYPTFAFEPEMEHEIAALEDDTIIINMRIAGPPGQAGADGGITFDDS